MTQVAPRETHRPVQWTAVGRTRRRRSGHVPRPMIVDVLATLCGLGLGITIALVLVNESTGSLSSPGGWWTAAGRLTGMVGTYLMLVMVVLIARIPWFERAVGQDQLVKWHRTIGGWPIVLIGAHVVLVTVGYSSLGSVGFFSQLWSFITTYPDVLAATVGFALLVLVGVSSFRIARHRQHYETWWVVHLYTYLALALAFAHQIVTGLAFLNHPLSRWWWAALWAGAAGLVLLFRVGLPVWRNLRHQLRIDHVIEEAPGVYSVTCIGKGLDRLAVSGGQFFQWRFVTRELWWHAHPYSLSALPRSPYLRVTVKGLGDHSAAVAGLRRGTRVLVEGPYGAFTHHVRRSHEVVLVGAGVGITPLRAMLDDLPAKVPVTVIVRASRSEDLVHHDEIKELVARRGGKVHELVGSRGDVVIDAELIKRLVPRAAVSDFYLCGPAGFTEVVERAALACGASPDQIHSEAFAF